MTNRSPSTTRRRFLSSLGATGAALPFLARPALAAAAPRRLIVVAVENGTYMSEFWPRGGGSDLTKMTLGQVSEPLAPHLSDLIFLGGLELRHFIEENKEGSHEAWPGMLTGTRYANFVRFVIDPGGPTVDQFIAQALAKRPGAPPVAHLALQATQRVYSRPHERTCIASGRSKFLEPERDPAKVFDRLFSGPAMPPADLAKLRAMQKSVFDFVGRDLSTFQQRLPAHYRPQLEAFIEGHRALERQVSTPAGSCARPVASGAAFPAVLKTHTDTIVQALACDLTRVATLVIGCKGDGLGTVDGSWPEMTGLGAGEKLDHHFALTHGGYKAGTEMARKKIHVERWVMRQFAYLISELKKRTDVDGKPLLDNTVILHANCASNGGAHSVRGVPWILAGKGGGYFKTGQFLKSGGWAGKDGDFWTGSCVPQNGVLVALCNAMGVPVETFGDAKYGGELAGLKA